MRSYTFNAISVCVHLIIGEKVDQQKRWPHPLGSLSEKQSAVVLLLRWLAAWILNNHLTWLWPGVKFDEWIPYDSWQVLNMGKGDEWIKASLLAGMRKNIIGVSFDLILHDLYKMWPKNITWCFHWFRQFKSSWERVQFYWGILWDGFAWYMAQWN